jgi:2-polyprenyl-3-methyl-5-hydroxy-6-metoxy-1,4-benzoquinol methylase
MPFDKLAGKFAADIDQAVGAGQYVRGNYFVRLVQRWIPQGSYVLDYGCGPGRLGRQIQSCGLRVMGVDTSADMIEQARSLVEPGADLSFKVISHAREASSDGPYDAIVCSSVIEYVPDAEGLLRLFRASLRGPGVLIISFANSRSFFRRRWERDLGSNPMGQAQHHTWDMAAFKALLERNGFKVVSKPLYFESPWDWRFWGHWFRRVALVGSIGIVVAQAAF